MTFIIKHQGQSLSPEQAQAIAPVITRYMYGELNGEEFALACEKAMEDAGCPLIKKGGK